MIAFDLKCSANHVFEAWFGSSADYEDQKERGLLECPICGDTHITKAIMAPNVARKGNQQSVKAPVPHNLPVPSDMPKQVPSAPTAPIASAMPPANLPDDVAEKLMNAVAQVKEHVEKNCDYVGKDFAEEARKIHYGEADERGIYGETTQEEAEELLEEGLDVVPLPFVRTQKQFDA